MSASYIAKQIIKGGLEYIVVVAPSKFAKFRDEVDVLLTSMGYEHLIEKDEVEEDHPAVVLPELLD